MRANALALALLDEDAIAPPLEIVVECHVGDAGLRVANRQQSRELASRLNHGDRLLARRGGYSLRLLLRAVYELAQFLRELPMPIPGRPSRNLHGDRIEARVISLRMALDESFDLVCLGHWIPLYAEVANLLQLECVMV